jgi:hypothetical protein
MSLFCSNGENMYQPIAVLHKDFNRETMVCNFLLMIQRMTGISKATCLHLISEESFAYLKNKDLNFDELKSKLIDHFMTMDNDHDSVEDEDSDECKLIIVPLPHTENQMKFKIVEAISPDNVVDFHIGKKFFLLLFICLRLHVNF